MRNLCSPQDLFDQRLFLDWELLICQGEAKLPLVDKIEDQSHKEREIDSLIL